MKTKPKLENAKVEKHGTMLAVTRGWPPAGGGKSQTTADSRHPDPGYHA